jgi:hypothetical protein
VPSGESLFGPTSARAKGVLIVEAHEWLERSER